MCILLHLLKEIDLAFRWCMFDWYGSFIMWYQNWIVLRLLVQVVRCKFKCQIWICFYGIWTKITKMFMSYCVWLDFFQLLTNQSLALVFVLSYYFDVKIRSRNIVFFISLVKWYLFEYYLVVLIIPCKIYGRCKMEWLYVKTGVYCFKSKHFTWLYIMYQHTLYLFSGIYLWFY